MRSPLQFLQLITLSLALVVAPQASADNKAMIDGNTALALERLREHLVGAEELLDSAVGVLVFPDVVKMGFGEGGQYGEGALLVEREPVAYYATAGSKFGLQLGSQYKAEVILFMTEESLQQFRSTQGWKVGMHGNVQLVEPDGFDRNKVTEPMVGFIFSDEGLRNHLTLEGSKITRIAR